MRAVRALPAVIFAATNFGCGAGPDDVDREDSASDEAAIAACSNDDPAFCPRKYSSPTSTQAFDDTVGTRQIISNDFAADIFVATDGDDANQGTSDAPVKTLLRAARLAREALDGGDPTVFVGIRPGVYHDQRLVIPHDLRPKASQRVVFHGLGKGQLAPRFDGCTASGKCKEGGAFIQIGDFGTPTARNFDFYDIDITRYERGIFFRKAAGCRVQDVRFFNIGDLWWNGPESKRPCPGCSNEAWFGALVVAHSRDMVITSSEFAKVTRKYPWANRHEHTIYLMKSDDVTVTHNVFENCAGDIRVRDMQRAWIQHNVFRKTSWDPVAGDVWHAAAVSMWQQSDECNSHRITVSDNKLVGSFKCDDAPHLNAKSVHVQSSELLPECGKFRHEPYFHAFDNHLVDVHGSVSTKSPLDVACHHP